MARPCYSGPNPITQDERTAVWKWAKENGIDQGMDIEQVYDAVNQHFYAGQAKPGWIHDIFAGPKSELREVTMDMWRKQYNRRVIAQKAEDLVRRSAWGPVARGLYRIWSLPRSIAVFGHGIVFPVTHAGDLVFRPLSWGTFIRGTARTYLHAVSKARTAQMMHDYMHSDKLYDLALRSKLDVGPRSHATGLLSAGRNTWASRAWDLLTLMRFELWKKQMGRYMREGMTETERLELGQQLANWANHATGSAPLNIKLGGYTITGGEILFGPKLTGSKIARLTVDPAMTIHTFTKMALGQETTAGERAVAWTRLSGTAQFLIANAGFLAVNQGVLAAMGSKQHINFTDPTKGDFLQFKGGGLEANVPGLHSEIKLLSNILATSFASKNPERLATMLSKWGYYGLSKQEQSWAKTMGSDTKRQTFSKLIGSYLIGKSQPGIQLGLAAGMGEDWAGRPMPWSHERGTKNRPQVSWGEFAAQFGPIPLSGPVKYVYDQLKKNGASASDSLALTKALTIQGLSDPKTWGMIGREAVAVGRGLTEPKAAAIGVIGATGVHVREEVHREKPVGRYQRPPRPPRPMRPQYGGGL